jgi:hypothetical protein
MIYSYTEVFMPTTRKSLSSKRDPAKSKTRIQSEGRTRQKPGAGGGEYYRVEVRPKSDFITFRTQDVGTKGHIQRLAGKRSSGSWATATWLISKEDAHIQAGKLVADTAAARQLLTKLGSKPAHIQGDRFKAKDRPNVPERSKPTPAQRRARSSNIKKAQAVRLKTR